MKNSIYAASVLALIAGVIIGCKKNTIKQETEATKSTSVNNTNNQRTLTELNVTTANNMLVFKTSADYVNIVENQLVDERNVFLNDVKNMDFLSYAEVVALQPNNDVIKDEFVSQILNKDFVVQIGNYLYKLNKVTEYVYVLPVANIAMYADLVNENTANPNIKRYTTEQSVIELVENGNAGGKLASICVETGVGQRSDFTNMPNGISSAGTPITATLRHSKFGIYFDIVIDASQSFLTTNQNDYFSFEFNSGAGLAVYKRRCNSLSNVSPLTSPGTVAGQTPAVYSKYKPSQTAGNYSKYRLNAVVKYYNAANVLVSTSRNLEIRVNL
ncbi:MAG: hypothetical protein H7331_04610 [Bacteroidia bacterium]|nr:hypothetical protein [Bacteroidia bacterium]